MKSAQKFALVLMTVPNLSTARRLAKLVLEARLAACANLVPGLESHYWWHGKLERSGELLVLLKARTSNLNSLERMILANHPYDTPEIITLPLGKGTSRYLAWLNECTATR